MTLTDAGPILALVNPRDDAYSRCQDVFANPITQFPLLTTWPCVAEAMHFARKRAGWNMSADILQMLTDGTLRIANQGRREQARIVALMTQYRDIPMDLADASLVVLAERHGLRAVFTLDSHFYAYRLADGSHLAVVPAAPPV